MDPAPVSFSCSACGKGLRATAELAGKKVKCTQCGEAALVPEPTPTQSGEAALVPQAEPVAPRRRGLLAVVVVMLLISVGLVLVAAGVWFWWPAAIIPSTLPPASFLNVVVGHQAMAGVEDSGFYSDGYNDGWGPFRWTDGNARLVIPLDKKQLPRWLLVQLHLRRNISLQIRVNGKEFVNEEPKDHEQPNWEQTLDLKGLDLGDKLVVEILSSTFIPKETEPGSQDERHLGARVRGVKLMCGLGTRTVGQQAFPDVEDSGFYRDERNGGWGAFRWTNGNARLVIPLDKKQLPHEMLVQLHRPKNSSLQIRIDGREVVNEQGDERNLPLWEKTFDLRGLELGEKLVVEIVSSTVTPKNGRDSRALGARMRGVTLLRDDVEPDDVAEIRR
jgi:DNA-directed RNA polymerase subunit RPC12/RpoP